MGYEGKSVRAVPWLRDMPLTTMLAVLAFAALAIGVLWYFSPSPSPLPAGNATSYTPERPPFTPEVRSALAKSKGFAVLISYTDQGFEPTEVTIKKGEGARFTNNSHHDLWVAAQGSTEHPVYPGTSECGASPLDSCMILKPGEFWEFTFDKAGTWVFGNNLDKTKSGSVSVTVS